MPRLGSMRQKVSASGTGVLVAVLVLSSFLAAATKVHVITFGRWIPVQWLGAFDSPPLTSKVRPLLVDGRVKEYVVGSAHEITDRLFVVRRAFRINDALPEESVARWQWQRGGWLLVDRVTGRVFPRVCRRLILIFLWRVGIATTRRIVGWATTERKPTR